MRIRLVLMAALLWPVAVSAQTVSVQPPGQVIFTPSNSSGGGGGSVNSVSGGTGISVSGTASNPVVNLISPVTVPNGGSGLTTATAHGILLGEGTSPFVSLACPANDVPQGVAAADPVCAALVLAGPVFANQGTTTTVLHGNAAGNPSWTGVSLTADTTANQGTTTTVLHGNAAGQPSFGAVNLANDTTGTLSAANGGTGVASPTAHDLVITNGSSPFNLLSMGNDTFVQGNTGADPSAGTLPNCANDGSHALVYSTTTHSLSCAAITGGASTTDIFAENNFNSGTINPFTAVHNQSLANNATQTLISDTPGSAGVIRYFFLAMSFGDNNSTMTITTDGNTVFNDRACLYFGAEYPAGGTTPSFASKLIGMNTNSVNGSSNISYYSYIPIPFNTSVSITYTNKSGNTQHLYYWFEEYTGLSSNSWPRENHLWAKTFSIASAAYLSVNTLVNDTGLTNGRFLGIAYNADGTPGTASPLTAPLEGAIKVFIDGGGSPLITSSGTEDYPGFGFDFQSTASGAATYTTGIQGFDGTTFHSVSAGTYGGFRFHIQDPILFSNAIKATWNAGNDVSYTGTERFVGTVYYYTQ